MKPRVVLDTNVLISHFFLPDRNPTKILHLVLADKMTLVLSEPILREMNRILEEKAGFTQSELLKARNSIADIAEVITAIHAVDIIREDEEDNRILECALSGHAEFIVSGDKKHLLSLKQYRGIRILSPAEFLKEFQE